MEYIKYNVNKLGIINILFKKNGGNYRDSLLPNDNAKLNAFVTDEYLSQKVADEIKAEWTDERIAAFEEATQ